MGLFDNFPYTNLHEINLDWILNKLRLMDSYVKNAEDSANEAASSANEAEASKNAASGSAANAANSAQRAEDAAASIATYGRRFVLVGDSYLAGYTPDGIVNGWGYWFKKYAGLSGRDCYIFGEGRSGFCAIGSEGHTFAQFLSVKAPTVESPETITDVYFIGGYNDRSFDYSEISKAITAAAAVAKNLFPSARIKCGFVGRNVGTNNTVSSALFETSFAYRNNYSMDYLSGIEFACRDIDFFTRDGIHPTEDGYRVIGRALCDIVFCGGARESAFLRKPAVKLLTSVTLTGNVLSVFFDTKLDYDFPELDGQTLDGVTKIDMGLLNSGAMVTGVYDTEFSMPGFVLTKSDGWRSCTFTFGVSQERHFTMRCRCAVGAGGWAESKDSGTKIVLSENTVALPALFF